MQNITFEYPLWYLLLCGLAGLGVALLLYYRSRLDAPPWLLRFMAGLRFVGYSLLAALLLSPLLRFVTTDRQEPIVVMAQDVSESVGLETDTVNYARAWNELTDALSARYQVVRYTFGSAINKDGALSFTAKTTDIDAVLSEIADRYGNQNLGAVVLATDGIYNQGANPTYREYTLPAPVYTVGMGDTTRRRDLLVSRVFHNRIAYLDDRFSIQVDISARNAAGERTTLTVGRVGEAALHTENVAIEGDDFFTTREVVLPADRPGVQRYRISVSTVGNEVTTDNNQRDIYVEVLDARQNILLLAAAPHPDLSAIKQSLATGQNNEVEIAYGDRFVGEVADYDLVVLHQLPTPLHRISPVLQSLAQEKVPTLFITGPSLPPSLINAVQDLVSIQGGGAQVRGNQVTAVLSGSYGSFTLSEQLRRSVSTLPPLTAPFGSFSVRPGAEVLLRQRIGRVETEYPLLVTGESRGARTGVLLASGLWQWRLFDYLENGDHGNFDELISQLTQYLTVLEDKRRFRVTVAENLFDENQSVLLDADLYNTSYEPINTPEATVAVTGPEGRQYDYTFTRTDRAYTLNAGTLPPGAYTFRAATTDNGEVLTSEGRFTVQTVELERFALEADHALLREISNRYGGEIVFPGGLSGLADRLMADGGLKPILFETVNTRSVINLRWMCFILLSIFIAEWGMRRWSGGY